MLFGVSPADVVTYVGVALIVAGAVSLPAGFPREGRPASIRWWRCVTNSDAVRRVTPAIAAVLVMYGGFAGVGWFASRKTSVPAG